MYTQTGDSPPVEWQHCYMAKAQSITALYVPHPPCSAHASVHSYGHVECVHRHPVLAYILPTHLDVHLCGAGPQYLQQQVCSSKMAGQYVLVGNAHSYFDLLVFWDICGMLCHFHGLQGKSFQSFP